MTSNFLPKIARGFILVVSAPSGTGKTSLCDRLARELDFVRRSISVTTRPKRDGEVSTRDYEFVSLEEFERRDQAHELLESAEVFGHRYGTPRRPVEDALEAAKIIVMDIDTVGAFRVQSLLPKDTVLVFVLPPNLEELESRIRKRGKNSPEELARRLKEAAREIEQATQYDYVMVNESFEEAYMQLKAIVYAERIRQTRLQMK